MNYYLLYINKKYFERMFINAKSKVSMSTIALIPFLRNLFNFKEERQIILKLEYNIPKKKGINDIFVHKDIINNFISIEQTGESCKI